MTGIVDPAAASCPVPLVETERVLLGHGSGGQLSAELIRDVIVPALGAAAAGGVLQDAAVVALPASAALRSGAVVISTDSFVVSPLVFPGGDIGSRAVHGTVNDLAMRGAVPIALTAALVIEEGMPIETLRAIVTSMGVAAAACGVTIVACDLFGLDPLHVANEGCLVAFVAPRSVAKVLAAMRSVAAGTAAGQVGTVTAGPAGRVAMTTMVGVSRVVDMLVGEALPRIC